MYQDYNLLTALCLLTGAVVFLSVLAQVLGEALDPHESRGEEVLRMRGAHACRADKSGAGPPIECGGCAAEGCSKTAAPQKFPRRRLCSCLLIVAGRILQHGSHRMSFRHGRTGDQLGAPCLAHPLRTDSLGRDLWRCSVRRQAPPYIGLLCAAACRACARSFTRSADWRRARWMCF